MAPLPTPAQPASRVPALVVFDCDGVLVDSEPVAARVLMEALAAEGLPLTVQDVDQRYRGRSLTDCQRLIEAELGRPLGADFIPRLNALTFAEFERSLTAIAHVREALEVIRAAGLPICVASSGGHDKMRFTLGHTGLLPLLGDRLFSAKEVTRGKPAPDLFLHAANRMGHSPAQSVVIEDSVPGVTGAVAAGMRALGYAGGSQSCAEELRRAGAEVFHSMRELPALLGLETPEALSLALDRACELLDGAQAIGLPTETVYGLAADGTNPEAVARIFAIKGRPTGHPLILHLGHTSWLERYAHDVPERARVLAARFWPGPLTMVLRRSQAVPLEVTGGLETVALRVPAHPIALELLRRFDRPLAAPSANRFGSVSPTTRAHVLADLGDDVPLVLEGGPSDVGVESTIVDLSGEHPRLLRPGGISREQLEEALGEPVLASDGSVAAPGTLASHYAPSVPVQLVAALELWRLALDVRGREDERIGVLTDQEPSGELPPHVEWVQLGHDAREQAHELYAGLRELDSRGVSRILSSLPTEVGLGAAVADRLRRAAAPR
ncbi:MAG TPA: L-threonylcarbamoyladenylate synthase [Polyangiaceae bacterium]|nr:L-threonylcarbamoyladenylate synthase [Polyangiaceae bacterium]